MYDKYQEIANLDFDQLVDFFRSRGIKGYRNSTSLCPIASYLRGSLSDKSPIIVNCNGITIFFLNGTRIYLQTTYAMADFIARFDAGLLPDLDLRAG